MIKNKKNGSMFSLSVFSNNIYIYIYIYMSVCFHIYVCGVEGCVYM